MGAGSGGSVGSVGSVGMIEAGVAAGDVGAALEAGVGVAATVGGGDRGASGEAPGADAAGSAVGNAGAAVANARGAGVGCEAGVALAGARRWYLMTTGRTSEEVRVAVAGGFLVGSRAGMGEPALLLHGGPGLADYTGPLAEEFVPHFDTTRYQQRGLAPSLEVGPYDIETNVADAIAVVDALRLERVWLIGHSWGGHLAMHIAVAAPERVRGLISINARGAIPDGGISANFAALRERYEALYGRPPTTITLDEGWPLRFSNPREAPAFPGIAVNGAVLPEMEKSVKEHYERRTLVRGLPQLNVPALFIHGRMDPLPISASEDTARLMPGATVEVIEACGHFP